MKEQTKAFNISIIIHAMVFVVTIAVSDHMTIGKNLVVIDLTIEKAAEPQKAKSHASEAKQLKAVKPAPELSAKKQYPKVSEVKPIEEIKQMSMPESSVMTPASVEDISVETSPKLVPSVASALALSTSAVVSSKSSGNETKGSSSNTGTSPESENTRYIKENFAYIREMIQKKIVYPLVARKMGWEGKVTVLFIVSLDGSVRDIKIRESSGFEALDWNAIETVTKASPFPKPPVEAQLIIPIRYKLD